MKRINATESSKGSESDQKINQRKGQAITDERLKQWIQKHKVCFEVAPLIIPNHFTKSPIGFIFSIYAQHPNSQNRPSRLKDKEFTQLYVELEDVVRTAVLPEKPPCRCEIQPFDLAVRLRPESGLKPEVQLAIIVSHRDNTFRPTDKVQEKCIAEIQMELLRIGAQVRVWRNENKSPAS